MHSALRAVILLTVLISTSGISSCSTSGMKEPDVYVCTIIDLDVAECVRSSNTGDNHDISIVDLIGYQCVAPDDYAKIKTHHEALHKALNKK